MRRSNYFAIAAGLVIAMPAYAQTTGPFTVAQTTLPTTQGKTTTEFPPCTPGGPPVNCQGATTEAQPTPSKTTKTTTTTAPKTTTTTAPK
jgi:hypothetical protein